MKEGLILLVAVLWGVFMAGLGIGGIVSNWGYESRLERAQLKERAERYGGDDEID
jgi:ABC-type Fe3+ transport system permease subunit